MPRPSVLIIILAAAAVLALAQPALSPPSGFLKVAGVEGGSKEKGHPGWIDVVSYSWSGRAPASGSGPGSVTIVVRAGKAAPGLETKSGGGAKIPEVKLEVAGTGRDGKPGTFLYRMTDVTIASYEPGGGSLAGESVTFGYAKVSWTYTPQK